MRVGFDVTSMQSENELVFVCNAHELIINSISTKFSRDKWKLTLDNI